MGTMKKGSVLRASGAGVQDPWALSFGQKACVEEAPGGGAPLLA